MAKQSPTTRTKKNTKKPAAASNRAATKTAKKVTPKTANAGNKSVSSKSNNKLSLSRIFKRPVTVKKTPAKLNIESLTKLNRFLALLYLLLGVGILLLSTAKSIPVVANYLANDALANNLGEIGQSTALQHVLDVNVAYLLAGVTFIFALTHALASTILRKRYETEIKAAKNRLRWTTFAIGLGGLIILVSLLVGARDLASLGLLFGLTVLASVIASGVESRAIAPARGVLYVVGFIAFMTIWAVLAFYILSAGLYNGSIPIFVYGVFITTLILTFLITSTLKSQQAGVGKWADYVFAERRYMVLIFILIASVAGQVYLGMLTA